MGHHDVVSATNATHLQGGHEAAPPLVGREAVGQSQAGLQAVPLRAASGAGLKAELFDSGVNASLAYFNLRDTNRAVADPTTPGASIAQGEVEVQGIEVEASGSPLPGWEIAGGYTYTDSTYLNTAQAGQTFSTYTPQHMFQLWTKYAFDERFGAFEGVFVGGGVTAFSSFSSVSGGVTIKAPGYVTADLMAGYRINDNFTATLNVNNIFDEKYYSRVGGTSVFNFYGEPRSATFRLSAKF